MIPLYKMFKNLECGSGYFEGYKMKYGADDNEQLDIDSEIRRMEEEDEEEEFDWFDPNYMGDA